MTTVQSSSLRLPHAVGVVHQMSSASLMFNSACNACVLKALAFDTLAAAYSKVPLA